MTSSPDQSTKKQRMNNEPTQTDVLPETVPNQHTVVILPKSGTNNTSLYFLNDNDTMHGAMHKLLVDMSNLEVDPLDNHVMCMLVHLVRQIFNGWYAKMGKDVDRLVKKIHDKYGWTWLTREVLDDIFNENKKLKEWSATTARGVSQFATKDISIRMFAFDAVYYVDLSDDDSDEEGEDDEGEGDEDEDEDVVEIVEDHYQPVQDVDL